MLKVDWQAKRTPPRSCSAVLMVCWLMLANASAADQAHGDALSLVGALLPPFTYEANGEVFGLGADIYRELAARVGHSGQIQVMPYKRAFLNVQHKDNLLMSPVARVAAREGLVNWAIHYLNDAFFYVTRVGEPKLSHASAGGLRAIGVLRGSAPLAELQQHGVENFKEQTTDSVNLRLLSSGRIDAWFTSAILLSSALRANPDLTLSDFEIGDVQSRHCVYIVASNRVDAQLLEPWQAAFRAMREEGALRRIVQQHLGTDERLMALLGDLDVGTCGLYESSFSATSKAFFAP